jgi:phosphoglycerol transferase MdoB-like AlkP superfamily enzyme
MRIKLIEFFRNQQSISATILAMSALLLIIFGITRAGLLLYTGIDLVSFSTWPEIFIKGLWFDLVVISVLIAPLLFIHALTPAFWFRSRIHKLFRFFWLWLSIFIVIFSAVSEYFFWEEFSTRFNFIAVDYLIYTSEVLGNIRESYPVGKILIVIGIVSFLITLLAHQLISGTKSISLNFKTRLKFLSLAFALPFGTIYISSLDQMEISGNMYASELAGNGYFTMAAAMRRNELDYPKFYKTIPEEEASNLLTALDVHRLPTAEARLANFSKDHVTDLGPFLKRPKNLILISVESLSASFVGSYGSGSTLTPKLDAIAKEGLRFERVFATGTRTVRGLEALSLGTPPIPGQAIVRRPNNQHLITIGEVLQHQGYDNYFFYGGYGYFDNMNAYFSSNGYRIQDRTDFPKESVIFENIWGVADEVLFNNTITKLRAPQNNQRPFFAQIMTTSNHRPFTYPDNRIDIPSPGKRSGAVKYTDYAIGKFIEDAKKEPWFADTLFVIVADHCASAAGGTRLPVENYRIPLIFYAPSLLKPGVHMPMVSQIDIAPTLLRAVGKNGSEQFYGRSFFEKTTQADRAFISNYQELGYLKNNKLTVLLPKQRVQSYMVDPQTMKSTPTEIDEILLKEAIAYYQTASAEFKSGQLKAPFYTKK